MHFLVVTDLGEGEFDYDVLHEEGCPRHLLYEGDKDLFGGEHGPVWDWGCGVGQQVTWYGYDDLADDPRFKTEGTYPIGFWDSYDSFTGESEMWIEFVDAA